MTRLRRRTNQEATGNHVRPLITSPFSTVSTEAVKGYIRHERETLDAVIKARNSAMAAEQKVAADPSDPAAMRELNQAEAQLGGILGRLFALPEAYPDLKANQNMLALQEELSSTENKIAFARQAFNDAAATYNIRREVFPANTVA